MKAEKTLETLDRYAEDFDFPVLDNYNFDLAQSRISVFREEDKWLIVFEVVGVDANLEISNNFYVYSNSMRQQGFFSCFDEILTLVNEEYWYDDEDHFLVDPFHMELLLKGERITLTPTVEEYKRLGIETDSFHPTKLIRFLTSKYKEKFWVNPSDILDETNAEFKPNLFYQTEEWEHPDISEDQKPSESIFFQSLAKAIELNNVNLITVGKVNNDWTNWTWSDFEKQEEDDI